MEDPIYISALLMFGLLLKLVGFAVRDELWLRALVATGITFDALFYILRSEPVWISVGANMSLVAINLVLLLMIVSERTTWRISPADREIFTHFPTLTPGQFRRIRKMMREEVVVGEVNLALEGHAVLDLTLVFADRIEINKDGQSFPIAGPSFVGEIAFLTGNASSAGVHLPDGGRLLKLSIEDLRAKMATSPALANAMVALFGQELARKVADSVPMARAAEQRDPAVMPATPGLGMTATAGDVPSVVGLGRVAANKTEN